MYNHANSPFSFNPTRTLLDSKGDIWFYNNSNIASIQDGQWLPLTIPPFPIDRDGITEFAISNENRKYIVTHRNAVYEILKDSLKLIYWYDPFKPQRLRDMEFDSSGNVWIAGDGFVVMVNDSITDTLDSTNSAIPDGSIPKIYVDPEDNLWVFSKGAGEIILLRFDGVSWTTWEKSVFADYDIKFNSIQSDKGGDTWMGSKNGIFRYRNEIWEKIYETSADHLYFDRDGGLWIISRDSITQRIDDRWVIHDLTSNTLDSDENQCLSTLDASIDIGGPSGISRFNNNLWTIIPTKETVHLISGTSNGIRMAVIGNQLGTISESGFWKAISHPDLPDYYKDYNSLYLDPNGTIWVSTDNGLFQYAGGNLVLFLEEAVNDVNLDANGFYWIATKSGLVKFKDGIKERFTSGNSNLVSDYVSHLAIDMANSIWLSSQVFIDENCSHCVRYYYESHLMKYNGDTFTDIESSGKLPEYFIEDYDYPFDIDKIVAGEENGLWIINNGLMNIQEGSVNHYTHENSGMAHNHIKDILLDGNHNIWILHDHALSVFNPKELILPESQPQQPKSLLAYPNPSYEELNIRFNSTQDQLIEISIYDLTGKVVHRETRNIDTSESEIKISVRTYKAGIYIYHLRSETEIISGKFLNL